MALKVPNVVTQQNIFIESPEDDQIFKVGGHRRIPIDQPTGTKPDEYVVDAAGNGDYTTIAEALTALGSGSGTIRVLAGTYAITSNISLAANQSIIGSGYGTLIQTTSNITLITLTGNRSAIYMCRIDGNNGLSSQDGINIVGDECIVKDCWITQMGGDGIKIDDAADRFFIQGTIIEDIDVKAIDMGNSQHWMISDCIIDNAGDDGISMVGADFGSIIGCKIQDHGEDGLDMTSCTQICIAGCYIFSNGDNNNNGDGIDLAACNDCCITGNIIHTNDGYGVDVSGATCNRTVIVGNNIQNNEDGEINDAGTSTVNTGNAT